MVERAQRARELRESGLSWKQVAVQTCYASPGAACNAAKGAGHELTHSYVSKHAGETEEQRRRRFRGYGLKRDYGISLDDYAAMVETQGGGCRICGAEVELVVDHDHETGDVRGLLCNGCNSGLGFFRDSPDFLVRAAEYLCGGWL